MVSSCTHIPPLHPVAIKQEPVEDSSPVTTDISDPTSRVQHAEMPASKEGRKGGRQKGSVLGKVECTRCRAGVPEYFPYEPC